MKRVLVIALLALHALGWAAAAVQALLLNESPKGISPDAMLFGATFLGLGAGAGWLANRVRLGDGRALMVVSAAFVLLGAVGTLVGAIVGLAAASGPTDAYVGPIGALGLVVGLLHVGVGVIAFRLQAVSTPADETE